MTVYTHCFATPLGDMLTAVDADGALLRLDFCSDLPEGSAWGRALFPDAEIVPDAARCAEVERQIAAYFRGERREFDLPLAPQGTAFQRRVWEELRRIPCGETISYGQLAQRIGNPAASRAVGHANGRNPIAIVVPCHRVVGAKGALTGYAGGLSRKERLLALERGIKDAV